MKLSIIIPAYNEEDRIGPMLSAYLPFFAERFGDEVEFIPVINGSNDGTEQVVKGFADQYPQLRVIVELRPIGKGGAVIEGFEAAKGELVGYVDADGSTPPEAFLDLLDHMDRAPVAIASRWCRGAHVDPPQPFVRRVTSRVFNLTTRILFGLRLSDTQCGAKVMKREVMERILSHIGITKWAFDVDMLFQVRRAGFSMTEVPTTWSDVEGSKITVTEASLEMLIALARLRILYSPFRCLVRFYDRFLGPILSPPGAERDDLVLHSLLVMGSSQANNLVSLLLQIAMVRTLSSQEYGVMAAMLSMFGLLRVPLMAVGSTVMHFTSVHIKEANWSVVRAVTRLAVRDLTIVGAAILAVVVLLNQRIIAAFGLANGWPLVAVFIALTGSLYAPVTGGVLLGAQRFGTSAVLSFSSCLVNLIVAVTLVLAGQGAMGPLIGHAGSIWMTALLGGFLVYRMIPHNSARSMPVMAGAYRYFVKYLVGSFCLLFLMSADVLFAKYFLSDVNAGNFAKAAAVSRMVVMLPLPIMAAMVPKVASTGDTSDAARSTRRKSLFLGVSLSVGLALMIMCFPGTVFLLFRKNPEVEILQMARWLPLVYLPLVGVNTFASFEFAQRRFRMAAVLAAGVFAFMAGAYRFHQDAFSLILVEGVATWLSLGGCLLLLKFAPRSKGGRS